MSLRKSASSRPAVPASRTSEPVAVENAVEIKANAFEVVAADTTLEIVWAHEAIEAPVPVLVDDLADVDRATEVIFRVALAVRKRVDALDADLPGARVFSAGNCRSGAASGRNSN
jgi:hypothetical protein